MSFETGLSRQGGPLWAHILGSLLVLGVAFCLYLLFHTATDTHALKADYAELHSVRYELANPQIWATRVSDLLNRKLDELELTEQDRTTIKRNIEDVLDRLILEVDRIVRERNQRGDGWIESTGNWLRQWATDVLIDIESLRKKVPEFAAAVMDELEDPASREDVKRLLQTRLQQLAAESFTPIDMGPYRLLLERYGCLDREACTPRLQALMQDRAHTMARYAAWALGLTFALYLLFGWHGRRFGAWGLLLLVLGGLLLLVPGVALPMIEIEAKIEELRLFILGEPLVFTNQVLYFQSKSITDVVRILVATDKAEMVLVGVLLTLFSILFPTMKLLATYVYFYNLRGLAGNALIRFFALRSGKWSMADVMVVALFMAYLGFDGVVADQLSHLQSAGDYLNVLTTNGTHLEAGFFLFLGFVLAGLGLSTLVEHSARVDH